MILLLDTHTAIWAAVASLRLPPDVRTALAAPTNDVYYSIASLLEIAIKNAPGRRMRMPLSVQKATTFFEEMAFARLDLHPDHLAVLEGLPLLHGDPFDRLLVSQAIASGMRLITHDSNLAVYGDTVLVY